MTKAKCIENMLGDKLLYIHPKPKGIAFAPTNIALCKYWGKRNTELNLPMTSSLSIALPDKGAFTTLMLREHHDEIYLNHQQLSPGSLFVHRLVEYLNLFRLPNQWFLHVDIQMSIPVAAGLASSACGFASLVMSLNDLFGWRLTLRELSILARLGSGSAARSLWNGFVEWHAGVNEDGLDSYAVPIDDEWPELRVGILSFSEQEKPISSRTAMQRTLDTSVLYQSWPKKVMNDMSIIKQAIHHKNIALLGGAAESNALAMHATMLSSWPPVCYSLPETVAAMHQIWNMRTEGLSIYFTQDAGPNLKLLFLEAHENAVKKVFPNVSVVRVFE
jgi:diphosphomevalonate decarboxylase